MVYVSRRELFSSAHKLWNNQLSDEENHELFDKCAYPNYHGHNYELIVTLKGEINIKTGYVFDLKLLSKLIKELVINKLDHRNLNLDVDFLKNKISTAENIIVGIWNELYNPIKAAGCLLYKIKLIETENNYVEYYGEN
jgi:6-pyruvoyltetrahydropterin/6-carboxytetrahydropterin synthase